MSNVENLDSMEITRYLNLEKFLDFIQFNRLYFRQVDKFEHLEGNYTEGIYEFSKKITVNGSNTGLIEGTERKRKLNYVNCWTLSNSECMAMWQIYGGNNGVAVQTTASIIKNELENAPLHCNDDAHTIIPVIGLHQLKLYFDKVEYIDHRNENFDIDLNKLLTTQFFFKNVGYSYEKEFRFICNFEGFGNPSKHGSLLKYIGDGFCIKIDTKKIVKKILVAPNADELHFNNVKALLEKYGFNSKILAWSSLRLPPYNEADFK